MQTKNKLKILLLLCILALGINKFNKNVMLSQSKFDIESYFKTDVSDYIKDKIAEFIEDGIKTEKEKETKKAENSIGKKELELFQKNFKQDYPDLIEKEYDKYYLQAEEVYSKLINFIEDFKKSGKSYKDYVTEFMQNKQTFVDIKTVDLNEFKDLIERESNQKHMWFATKNFEYAQNLQKGKIQIKDTVKGLLDITDRENNNLGHGIFLQDNKIQAKLNSSRFNPYRVGKSKVELGDVVDVAVDFSKIKTITKTDLENIRLLMLYIHPDMFDFAKLYNKCIYADLFYDKYFKILHNIFQKKFNMDIFKLVGEVWPDYENSKDRLLIFNKVKEYFKSNCKDSKISEEFNKLVNKEEPGFTDYLYASSIDYGLLAKLLGFDAIVDDYNYDGNNGYSGDYSDYYDDHNNGYNGDYSDYYGDHNNKDLDNIDELEKGSSYLVVNPSILTICNNKEDINSIKQQFEDIFGSVREDKGNKAQKDNNKNQAENSKAQKDNNKNQVENSKSQKDNNKNQVGDSNSSKKAKSRNREKLTLTPEEIACFRRHFSEELLNKKKILQPLDQLANTPTYKEKSERLYKKLIDWVDNCEASPMGLSGYVSSYLKDNCKKVNSLSKADFKKFCGSSTKIQCLYRSFFKKEEAESARKGEITTDGEYMGSYLNKIDSNPRLGQGLYLTIKEDEAYNEANILNENNMDHISTYNSVCDVVEYALDMSKAVVTKAEDMEVIRAVMIYNHPEICDYAYFYNRLIPIKLFYSRPFASLEEAIENVYGVNVLDLAETIEKNYIKLNYKDRENLRKEIEIFLKNSCYSKEVYKEFCELSKNVNPCYRSNLFACLDNLGFLARLLDYDIVIDDDKDKAKFYLVVNPKLLTVCSDVEKISKFKVTALANRYLHNET